jgi:hypoxanthine phosphoribosyltransferase
MSIFNDKKLTPLIDRNVIANKVQALGLAIKEHYQNQVENLVLVGILKGSIFFLADLARAIDLPLEIELMGVSSYGESTISSGVVKITQDLTRPIKDKHVLIVEDIIDTGLTLSYLIDNLKSRGPKSIKTCTLLKKQTPGQINIMIDFIGFPIGNDYVVGYGLDVAERYRNLPFIALYKA